MYEDFFELERKPFNVTPDPDFIYYSDQHKEALAHLLYGVQERRGFLLVTGRVGSGKTTLCRAFLRELEDDTATALILNSKMGPQELIETIAEDFGLEIPEDPSRKEIIDLLNDFLLTEFEEGRNACVIVDESQNLSSEALEQLRLLSNLETEKQKLLQIVLVGQPELENKLNQPELRQLKQRIAVKSYLTNLNEQETREYIQHRINLAGNDNSRIGIKPGVFEKLYQATEGNPRAINLLGDRMLMAAFVDDSPTVTEEHLQSSIDELTTDISEVEDRNSLVLRQVLHSDLADNWRSYLPNFDEIGSLLRHQYTLMSFTAALVLFGGVYFWSGFIIHADEPVIKEPKPEQLNKLSTVTDTPPLNQSADTNVNAANKPGNENTNPSMSSSDNSPKTNNPGVSGETVSPSPSDNVQSEVNSSTNSDRENTQSEEDTFRSLKSLIREEAPFLASQNNLDTLPDYLDMDSVRPEKIKSDTLEKSRKLSMLRYVSYRLSRELESDTSRFHAEGLKIEPLKINEKTYKDTLPHQTVKLNESRDEILYYQLPTLIKINSPSNRYVLYLPAMKGIWDPLRGWVQDPQSILSENWKGEAEVLVQLPFDPKTLMSFTQSGERIRELQKLLNEAGNFDIPLVGNFGPKTRRKVKEYQRNHGLPPDGVAGPKTYLSLLKESGETIGWSNERLKTFLEEVPTTIVTDQESSGQSPEKQNWEFL